MVLAAVAGADAATFGVAFGQGVSGSGRVTPGAPMLLVVLASTVAGGVAGSLGAPVAATVFVAEVLLAGMTAPEPAGVVVAAAAGTADRAGTTGRSVASSRAGG